MRKYQGSRKLNDETSKTSLPPDYRPRIRLLRQRRTKICRPGGTRKDREAERAVRAAHGRHMALREHQRHAALLRAPHFSGRRHTDGYAQMANPQARHHRRGATLHRLGECGAFGRNFLRYMETELLQPGRGK